MANGDSYLGSFKNGVFDGPGTFRTKEYSFEGNFRDNYAEEDATVKFSNGDRLMGFFKQNLKMGPVKFFLNYKGQYKEYKGEFKYNVENISIANFGPRF